MLRTVMLLLCLLLAVPAMAQDGAGVDLVALVMRWLHLLSAILMLGGAVFMRFILLPAASSTLDADTHDRLRAAILPRWRRAIMVYVTLFLVSGFYNFFMVGLPAHRQDPLYHALFGIKFLVAMAVFAIAMMLVGKKQRFGANAPAVAAIMIALAVLVVLIAGYMKVM
jgi:uncharacterized membrane protein